jgi:O-antigen/teichoic acid export membrane protein
VTDEAATPKRRPAAGSLGRFLLVGGASVLVAHLVGLASGTANQMLLARLLAPEALAAYFLTLSVVEVAAQVAHLGLPRPLTRLVAQARARESRSEARGVLEAALPLWLAGSLGVVLVYASGLGEWLARRAFDSEIMASATVVAALWIAAQGSADLLSGALRGFRRVGLAAWVGGTFARVALTLALLALFLGSREIEFPEIVAIATATAGAAVVVALFALRSDVAGATPERVAKRALLSAALPILLSGVVGMAYHRVDLWTVGALYPAEQVAIYGAAKRLIVLITLPIVILSLVVPPVVAELHASRDLARLQRALRGSATLAGLPAIAMLLLLVAANETVLGLVYGDFFRQGGFVLALLCIERLVFVWVGPSAMVLAMTGHEAALMRITLATALLTGVTVLLGSALWGFHGVAAGYVAGSTGQQLATWLAVWRLTGLRTDIDVLHLGPVLDALRRATRR